MPYLSNDACHCAGDGEVLGGSPGRQAHVAGNRRARERSRLRLCEREGFSSEAESDVYVIWDEHVIGSHNEAGSPKVLSVLVGDFVVRRWCEHDLNIPHITP